MINKKLKKYQKKILKKMKLKPTKKTLDNLTEKEAYIYNTYRQKIIGKKKYDYFEITELGKSAEDIFCFKNILEWDKENFKFQETARKKDTNKFRKAQKKRGKKPMPKYTPKKYNKLYMPGDWFRILEKDNFRGKRRLVYGSLFSAQYYITLNVFEAIEEYMHSEIYPFIYARPYGKELFEKIPNSKFSKMTDHDKRAAGKEAELELLEKEVRKLYEIIEKDVQKRIKHLDSYTFRKTTDEKENMEDFVIGGFSAAKKISFKTFLPDFYELLQPIEVIENIEKKLIKKYKKIVDKKNKKIKKYLKLKKELGE